MNKQKTLSDIEREFDSYFEESMNYEYNAFTKSNAKRFIREQFKALLDTMPLAETDPYGDDFENGRNLAIRTIKSWKETIIK